MSRTYQTEGIVLKKRNFGEVDKIITIYSKHYGKIGVIAKGVRKITSKKAGSLELFNHCNLTLAKGKNLDIISEVEVINNFSSWRKNLGKIAIAYYFCELIDKLTAEGQTNKSVFELLKSSLLKINSINNQSEFIMSFETHLLKELGFGIPFEIKNRLESLKTYIESIIEKEIKTPRLLLNKIK